MRSLRTSSLALPLCLALAASAWTPNASAEDLPAFPGAEGFGASATGGRGGRVVIVDTLASSGPGSLQEALSTAGPRIIVFAVSGVIAGDHTIEHGDVTLAGQTAPGAGITIAGRLHGAYDISVTNIVVRHLRIRPEYQGGPGELFDAVQLSRNRRVILDHVSLSGGVDENLDVYEAQDVTIQWSTIEASATAGHPEGEHNYGLINGPEGQRVSLHHNLFAHHKNRCPAIANGPAEVLNNVVYDVRHGFVHHNPASGPFNIVGNVFIQGPMDSLIPFFFDDEAGGSSATLSYFLEDNFVDDPGDYVGAVDNPWQTPPLHPSFESLAMPESFRAETAHDFSSQPGHHDVETQPALEAEAAVLERAGAFPRDVVTLRTLDEVAARSGGWGTPQVVDLLDGLAPETPPLDADQDGMADGWEVDHGLDPTDAEDHAALMPSGYTAIEDYINELAAQLDGGASPATPDPPPDAPGDEAGADGAGPPPSPSTSEPDPSAGASEGNGDAGGCRMGRGGAPTWRWLALGAALALTRRRRPGRRR